MLAAGQSNAARGPGSEPLRAAQRSLPLRFQGVRAGPDTDGLDSLRHRYDGCPLSDPGLDAHARAWLDAVWPES